jgi:2-dehydro-3-deoxygalactonokinase
MKADWIAVDWGTSNLRIWAMGKDGNALAEKRSEEGMGGLAQKEFEPVLLTHIDEWLDDRVMPIVACGMVGARQGWLEAPYDQVPGRPAQKTVKVATKDKRLDMWIISGMAQQAPADVMRGEETQIAGFLSSRPDYKGIICLPGTHSKWVSVEAGMVVRFQTALTGELFALLSGQSVLRHSLGRWDDKCFLEVVKQAFEDPAETSMRLFEIRAKDLLEGDDTGAARLSATLIGAELAGMREVWQGQKLTLIGVNELARLYRLALESFGVKAENIHAETLTIEGLHRVYREVF